MSASLGKTRTWLLTWPEKRLGFDEERSFHSMIARRAKREPVAYILGRRDFYDLTLEVNRDVLIPRAETEVLVSRALEFLQSCPRALVLDLGTGSGAIALAVARHAPQSRVVGSDVSSAATAIAMRNAEAYGIGNVEWRQGDLFDVVSKDEKFDLILSNPPYVSAQEYELLEPNVRDYEPRVALVAEESGLAILRRICREAPLFLARHAALGVEIGASQGEAVAAMMQDNLADRARDPDVLERGALATVRILADLAGHDRVVWGQSWIAK